MFFFVCENPSWHTTAGNYFKNTWYIHIDPKDCVSYEGMTLDIRYSKNKGVTWNSLTKVVDDSTEVKKDNIYALYNIGVAETVYLSYAFISNCEDPISVLSDLRDNVFDDKHVENRTILGYEDHGNGDLEEVTLSYLVEYYEDFPVYRNNYKRDDVIIPSG